VGMILARPRPIRRRRRRAAFTAAGSSPLAAGTASFVSSGTAGIVVTVAVATGGQDPKSYQWQRSTTSGSGFSNLSNGGGVSGATTRDLTDGSASAGTLYYYRNVATDNVSATANSNEVSAQVYSGGTLTGGGGSVFGSSVIRAA
jgi:hypothetical protein